MINLRTYCKKSDPTDAAYIEPSVWGAFKGKWKRQDYGNLLAEYSGFSLERIREIAENAEHHLLAPAIRKMSEDIADRVIKRELNLEPVSYEKRIDGCSGKLREIGIEHPLHQVMEHVAVYCLRDLFDAKMEDCQYASIEGRGQEKGAAVISGWVQADNRAEAYCIEHGYRHNRSTEYYAQGDIKKCFPSIKREVAMRKLMHDVTKNDVLLWMVNDLLKLHLNGLIIGSLLSQFLCNYLMSFAIREVYGLKKTRRGKPIKLVHHQLWYMDDFLITGPDRRNVKLAFGALGKYLKNEYGLELKEYHVKRWSAEPPDIMGYVIHCDGRITIRDRTFIKGKRAFVRAKKNGITTVHQARRIVSFKGRFRHSDCNVVRTKLCIEEVSATAQRFISDYETGRVQQCLMG